MQTTFHLAISNEKIKPNLSGQNHNWINCEKNFNKLTTWNNEKICLEKRESRLDFQQIRASEAITIKRGIGVRG